MQKTERLTVEQVETRLSQHFGPEGVRVDLPLAESLTGQSTPVVKVTPESEDQASMLLRITSEYGLNVAPVGGATQLSLGNIPEEIDVAISSERLDQVLDYSPKDMVLSVQAGVTLAQVQALLVEHGQQLPIDPLTSDGATIGGLVATGVSGPMRALYGGLRDLTIGLHTVYPNGNIVKAGGKVVKNVAGYDMTKLFIGSLGSLAFITEAAFKVRPIPEHVELCLLAGSAKQVEQLSVQLIHSHLIPARMEALSGGLTELEQPNRPWVLAVESHENETSSSYQTRTLVAWGKDLGMDTLVLRKEEAEGFWRSYRNRLLSSPIAIRVTAPPNRMMDVMEYLQQRIAQLGLHIRVSAGVFIGIARVFLEGGSVSDHERAVQLCRETVALHGGSAVLETAPLNLRQKVDSFGPTRLDFPLIKGIKTTIDPNRRMNPGRFVGGI